jgi:DNA polymerase
LEIIKPLVILCLGAPAANVIIHKDFRMTKERGMFFPSQYARYAIAALHPAYVLRQHGEPFEEARASLLADIAAARHRVIEAKREPQEQLVVREKPPEQPDLRLF